MEDVKVLAARLDGQLTTLDNKIVAAHVRVDNLQLLLKEDLRDIKESFKEGSKDLKEVIAWMNHSKGRQAAYMFLSSFLGVILGLLSRFIFKG